MSKLEFNNINKNSLNTTEIFATLTESVQNNILDKIDKHDSRIGGMLGRLFGIDEKMATIYSAIIIIASLIIIWILFNAFNIYIGKYVDLRYIESLLTLIAGFLFGKTRT